MNAPSAAFARLPPALMLYDVDQRQIAASTGAEPTDEQLMARIQARDETALAALYRRRMPILRTIILHVVHNDYDADELLQEVFVQLWNAADRYDQKKGKALGWIVTLARRRAIDKVRRCQSYARAGERLRLETAGDLAAVRHHAVADQVNADDTAEFFRGLLATLPEAQRQAVHLAYYRGLSQREIAAQTGIPLGTIKTRIELGMRKIRRAIGALGGAGEWSRNAATSGDPAAHRSRRIHASSGASDGGPKAPRAVARHTSRSKSVSLQTRVKPSSRRCSIRPK